VLQHPVARHVEDFIEDSCILSPCPDGDVEGVVGVFNPVKCCALAETGNDRLQNVRLGQRIGRPLQKQHWQLHL